MEFNSIPLIALPGGPELLIILAAVILLFGATKLPDLARGAGQALRIFKSETRELRREDEHAAKPDEAPLDDDGDHRP